MYDAYKKFCDVYVAKYRQNGCIHMVIICCKHYTAFEREQWKTMACRWKYRTSFIFLPGHYIPMSAQKYPAIFGCVTWLTENCKKDIGSLSTMFQIQTCCNYFAEVNNIIMQSKGTCQTGDTNHETHKLFTTMSAHLSHNFLKSFMQ